MANEWINHPDLKNLDPIKLQLIRTAAANAGNKTGKDLAPVMMARRKERNPLHSG